jgi:hypothetical protein
MAMATILQADNLVSANFWPTPSLEIRISTFSGELGHSVPLDADARALNVEVHVSTGAPAVVCIIYSIDGSANVTLTNLGYKTWAPSDLPNNHDIYYIEENLDNLSDGSHTLKVYSRDANGAEMSGSREFTVDTPNEPNPTPTPTPTPTSSSTPNPIDPTSTPYQEPQQTEREMIIGAAIAVAVIGAGLGFLIYLIKRK